VPRVIDLECNLPLAGDAEVQAYRAALRRPSGYADPGRLDPLPGYGFDNYSRIFAAGPARTEQAPAERRSDVLMKFVADMERAGVEVGVVTGVPNNVTAEVIQTYPRRFMGFAALSPHDGMRAVRELERLVRDQGLGGLRVSSLYNGVPASDRRYYPLYAKCVELDVPVRIYTAMTYANDRPYDLGHPRHLDQIAMDFPELRIIAGLGGWPWVSEMVALMRRHPNLYCDTAAHRPRHFATSGSGWEPLLQFGNTLLQDKVMVGLSWETIGLPLETLIGEYMQLPLKDSVKDKWLYANARRFLKLA
jgi:predicted TIM-barrel fold metal-dependent hydrolase